MEALDLPEISESLQDQIIQLPGVTSITIEKVEKCLKNHVQNKKKIIVTVRQQEEEKKEEEIRSVIEYSHFPLLFIVVAFYLPILWILLLTMYFLHL